ncbi:MAG: anti-sigma factor [Snowella sp.]|nr:anti-sigma factor [Snowella sp.]
MIHSQDSQGWQELLADYVLGEVTPEEAETVRQLLIAHPELQEEISHLQETLALIPLALPESSPPKKLGAKILRLAKAQPNSANSIVDSLRKKSKAKLLTVSSIALALILGLSVYNYRLHQELAIAQSELSQYQSAISTLPESNNRLLALKGTNQAPTATGVVLVMPKMGKAMMTVQNLKPLPSGKVYHLWAVANGKKFDCGQFNVNQKGKMMKQLPLDEIITQSSQLVITIEPNQSITQPTGTEVMIGNI